MLQDSLKTGKRQQTPPVPVLSLSSPATGTITKEAERSRLQHLL